MRARVDSLLWVFVGLISSTVGFKDFRFRLRGLGSAKAVQPKPKNMQVYIA